MEGKELTKEEVERYILEDKIQRENEVGEKIATLLKEYNCKMSCEVIIRDTGIIPRIIITAL